VSVDCPIVRPWYVHCVSPAWTALDDTDTRVWVHTSQRATTTTTVVLLGDSRCMVVDPAMEPSDLSAIADWVAARDLEVAFGWSTHAHWDHVLWSSRLGKDVQRFAVPDNVDICSGELPELRRYIEGQCAGHDLELCGVLAPVGSAGPLWPESWEVVEHRAHAPGHALLWLEDRGVLVVGDMVSDIEIPIVDLDQADPFGDYERALDLIESFATRVSHFVPGHGHAGNSVELRRRLELDRAYLAALGTGQPVVDDRLGPQWLQEQHQRQVSWFADR